MDRNQVSIQIVQSYSCEPTYKLRDSADSHSVSLIPKSPARCFHTISLHRLKPPNSAIFPAEREGGMKVEATKEAILTLAMREPKEYVQTWERKEKERKDSQPITSH